MPTNPCSNSSGVTDGQASVFTNVSTTVTNYNVPGDTDTTARQVTSVFNFQNGDFAQTAVGKYLYRVSSAGKSITNTFTVTNFPYAQGISGTVFSNNTVTVVSNAFVLLFQPSASGGNLNPVAGAVANNAGVYFHQGANVGTYSGAAARSNFIANLGSAPSSIVTANVTNNNVNLTLTNATQSISGRIVDTGMPPTLGIPGLLVPIESSTNSFLAIGFSDTNGNFNVGTRPDLWKVQSDSSGLIVHGYLAYQNSIKVSTGAGSVSTITNGLFKATAIFYGRVSDTLGNPLPGIDMSSQDANSTYQQDSDTDTNGSYMAYALSDGNLWQLQVGNGLSPVATNYVYSQSSTAQNGGQSLTFGQAVQVNITAILGTSQISGHVQDSNGHTIAGVGVFASATINGTNYFPLQVDTDANGNYVFNVPNASWSVSLNCQGGSDSLDNLLGNGNYNCPSSQVATIAGNNATNNFTIQLCSGISFVTPTPLPTGEVGVFYDQFITASDCNGNYNWSQAGGTLPNNLNLNVNGQAFELSGSPGAAGTSSFTVSVNDGIHSSNQVFSVSISNALSVATVSLPNGTNGLNYSQQLQANGGVPFGGVPYSWSLVGGSLPANLNLATNGLLSGTLDTNGTYNFTAEVTDTLNATHDQLLSLLVVSTNTPPLSVGTTGGQIIILWPASAGTNFTLQTTTNLATGPWVTASNGVPQISFIFSNTAPNTFFRLH